MGEIERPAFFSPAWWEAAAAAWNASGDTASLALFRTAVFRVTDGPQPPVWMHWDDAGLATRIASGRPDDPEFSAPLENWRGFFEGRFTAGMAVLRFKITFRGPVRRVLPYTRGLNAFARVARPLL
jgi:hypothetical protein